MSQKSDINFSVCLVFRLQDTKVRLCFSMCFCRYFHKLKYGTKNAHIYSILLITLTFFYKVEGRGSRTQEVRSKNLGATGNSFKIFPSYIPLYII